MAESTVPITVLVPRSLKRWLAEKAGKEGVKPGPYARRVLESHRDAINLRDEMIASGELKPITPKES